MLDTNVIVHKLFAHGMLLEYMIRSKSNCLITFLFNYNNCIPAQTNYYTSFDVDECMIETLSSSNVASTCAVIICFLRS